MITAGMELFAVNDSFGGLKVEKAEVVKVTRQSVFFKDRVSAFGWRTRLDMLNAERYATTDQEARLKHLDRCALELAGATKKHKAAQAFVDAGEEK